MAGKPAEAMIGVGALGLGVVLVFAAYKNVSPVALIRDAVTTGDLDWKDLPKIDPGTPAAPADPGGIPNKGIPANIQAIIDKIRSEAIRKGVSQGQADANVLQNGLPILSKDSGQDVAQTYRNISIRSVASGLITASEGITLNEFINARAKEPA